MQLHDRIQLSLVQPFITSVIFLLRYLSIFLGYLDISILYESCQDIFSCFLDFICYY
nr:MAG TPA: hypothetical protein [Caudoviricetes sp.]